MSDLVERVARALSVADGMHPEAVSNDEDQVPAWTLYVDDARAAIEATNYATLETALRTIQSAVPKYLKKEMTAEEFIDAVLAAADDMEVVRAVREASRPASISRPSTATPDEAGGSSEPRHRPGQETEN